MEMLEMEMETTHAQTTMQTNGGAPEREAAALVAATMRERRSKRAFLNTPVPMATVRRILSAASHAPSSSNTQPWRCYVVTGEARQRITDAAVAAYRANPETLPLQYPFFPKDLPAPFKTRFHTFRGMLGDAQGSSAAISSDAGATSSASSASSMRRSA